MSQDALEVNKDENHFGGVLCCLDYILHLGLCSKHFQMVLKRMCLDQSAMCAALS